MTFRARCVVLVAEDDPDDRLPAGEAAAESGLVAVMNALSAYWLGAVTLP